MESLKQFFETMPPNGAEVIDLITTERSGYGGAWLYFPDIELYCENEKCEGVRFFSSSDHFQAQKDVAKSYFIYYRCRNCSSNTKMYSVLLRVSSDGISGEAIKYGEIPIFGPRTPSRLISLIGPEKDLFLKGRRCESQGLGIGAFAYYRRVIESQKDRLLDEVIKVAQKVDASTDVINDLRLAKNEQQFSKAIESIKHGLPQMLLIDGNNPLLLLHSALSQGLHAESDEKCLSLATSVRVVLSEFVERISVALRSDAELKTAVSNLLVKKSQAKALAGDQKL